MIIFTDNSNWNGDKNWQKEVDAGAEGTILRASHGLYKDLRYDKYKAECPHKYIGSYNYFDYRSDGADQCKRFLDITGNYGNIRGIVDLEDNYANGWPLLSSMFGTALSRLMAWVDQYILETGHTPIAYLNTGLTIQKDWWGKYIFRNFVSKCGLWVANYNQSIYINGAWVKMERPPTGAWPECLMWQYTSKADGYLYGNGIGNSAIDLNRVFDLQAMLKPGFVPEEPPVVIPPVVSIPLMVMPSFSQNDPRWAYNSLGTSDRTIGSDGCVITAAAAICVYYGHDTNPGQLNRDLIAAGGYASGNLLIWDTLHKLYPDITVDWDMFIRDTALVTEAKIDAVLTSRRPVMAQVDFNPTTTILEPHWVTLTGKDANGYVMNDSIKGGALSLNTSYVKILRTAVYNGTPASPVVVPPAVVSDAEKLLRLWNAHPDLH